MRPSWHRVPPGTPPRPERRGSLTTRRDGAALDGSTRRSPKGPSVTDMSDPDVPRAVPEPVLNTAALQTDAVDDTPVPRRQVLSWAMWDWATQPFNSVILTFVFVSLYLVSDSFLADDIAAQNADGSLVCSRTADAAT
jgi:hypothetical protein